MSEEAYHSYLPGSRQEKDWIRQPLRPDWYDDPQPAGGCQPDAPSRTSGNLHISLDNLTDQHQRFSCVGFNSEWTSQTTRTLALYRNGQLVAQKQDSSADFAIPAQAADYRLIYDQDASSILPVSTKVNTAWTFHSAGPAGTESVPLALLSIDYALPLDLSNHPTDGKATLTVRQAHGAATQHVTSLALWVSTDDGTTWTTVPVARTQDGQYTAQLPVLSAGEAMSLRVKAEADGGSGVEQTVIRAYRAG